MNLEQFERRALAYGADIARWPQPEQGAARALVQTDETARAVLADVADLDAVVRRATETEPAGSAFTGKILSALQLHVRSGYPMLTAGWRWAFSVSAVAALALGFFTGLSVDGRELLSIDSASALTLIADQPGEFEILL